MGSALIDLEESCLPAKGTGICPKGTSSGFGGVCILTLLLLSLCDLGSLGGPGCPAMTVGGGLTCGNPPKGKFAPAV